MDTKTIVITGGTAGIGLAAATILATRGHRLILIARDPMRGARALSALAPPASGTHRFISADLARVAEVRSVAADIDACEPHVDVLANNAGTWFERRELTAEGLERTFALNHLAYVALTLGLKRRLLAAPQGKVINTSSFVYRHAHYDADDLQFARRFSTNGAYAATKLYNVMFTRALARRWATSTVTVNSFSPGFVATEFGKGEGGWLEPYYRFIRRFAIPAERGAGTLVYLAELGSASAVTGAYYEKRRPRPVRGVAADEAAATDLLERSTRLAGFDPSEI